MMIPIVLFTAIAITLALLMFFRFKTRRELQLTIRSAIDKGQDLTPDFLQQLTESLTPKNADLRRGIVSIAVGLGFITFALMLGEEDATGPLMGISAFPFLIGIAYVALWFFGGNRK